MLSPAIHQFDCALFAISFAPINCNAMRYGLINYNTNERAHIAKLSIFFVDKNPSVHANTFDRLYIQYVVFISSIKLSARDFFCSSISVSFFS